MHSLKKNLSLVVGLIRLNKFLFYCLGLIHIFISSWRYIPSGQTIIRYCFPRDLTSGEQVHESVHPSVSTFWENCIIKTIKGELFNACCFIIQHIIIMLQLFATLSLLIFFENFRHSKPYIFHIKMDNHLLLALYNCKGSSYMLIITFITSYFNKKNDGY